MKVHSPRSTLSRIGGVVAGAALVGASALVAAAAPAQADTGCRVTYVLNDWGGGFTADLVVTNLSGPLTSWTLELDYAGDVRVAHAWNSTVDRSSGRVALRNAAWNAALPTGGETRLGFLASYTGADPVPTRFTLNGVACNGPGPTASPSPSDVPPTSPPILVPRVDNPYVGATGYVNPEWKAKAESVKGGSRVSGTPTAVWLDGLGTIEGRDGSGAKVSMGVRDHLDTALAQGAGYVQFVLYNLPGRDCGGLFSGELAATEIERYERDFIDPIAAIQADPKYRDLRIVNIVEPGSLGDLVVNVEGRNTMRMCHVMADNGNYSRGIAYALDRLRAASGNVYNYLDAGYHTDFGYTENQGKYVELLARTVRAVPDGVASVHGFVVNVAGYAATVEPYFKATDVVRGEPVQFSKWVDWNKFIDAQSYATAIRQKLITAGFAPSIGMLIDTSRNGWGGPKRPTGPVSTAEWGVNRYVDGSRIDRRRFYWNWCNQPNAGLGERPTAAPAPGIDAYVWAKPPGESDGPAERPAVDSSPLCDPHYISPTASSRPSDALPGAPEFGVWFPEHFAQLMENAYPPL